MNNEGTPIKSANTSVGTLVTNNYSLAGFAGQSVVLSLTNHNDNYPSDPTYSYVDDVSIH